MHNTNNNNEIKKDDITSLKEFFYKFLFFWKFFLLSIFLSLSIAFIYLRYSPKIYNTYAKIKILDENSRSIDLPSASDIFQSSKINLENEIEILASSNIVKQVVSNLSLNLQVYGQGSFLSTLFVNYPFNISLNDNYLDFGYSEYFLEIIDDKPVIRKDSESESEKFDLNNSNNNLPFSIINFNLEKFKSGEVSDFKIVLIPISSVIREIQNNLRINQVGKKSEIIMLSFDHNNTEYSKNVLNELIQVFNNDGIVDRQLVHKRTIEFVNDRFINLSLELDSIEGKKQFFKSNNSIVDLSANAFSNLESDNMLNESVFLNENQISLTKMLLQVVADSNLSFNLLPSNLGIEAKEVNILITDFNLEIIKRNKLIISAGMGNPLVKIINNNLLSLKSNIFISLNNYLDQLSLISQRMSSKSIQNDAEIFSFPEKEKILRSIERNQKIKESLFLFLLQKREEAQVSYAITDNSIKVVEFATSSLNFHQPRPLYAYVLALIFGFGLPFFFLYITFLLNTKIYSRDDILALNLGGPVIGEIPSITDESKIFDNPVERSVLAEAFRTLSSNLKYLLPNKDSCNVILSTSTIKGEGKTFNALNLSLALSSIDKKVLLIGCDLRNPQLHKYLNIEKSEKGLVDFLVDNKFKWKTALRSTFDHHPTHFVLISGSLPPNPVQLLNNGNLQLLLDEAKKDFDYIILDTAPTLLVTDTISITDSADVIVYVSRSNFTEKDILNFPKDLISSKKIKNVGFIVNGLGSNDNKYGYQYGYQYGYSYGYKYGYNYGYGYGYEEDKD